MTDSKALIYQSELDFVSKCVMEYPQLETGGDFFGSLTRDMKFKIELVIGPGNSTSRSIHSFYQDIDYLKTCGSFLNNKFGLQHIGAWHSHHGMSLNYPSSGDVNTMRNALNNDNLPAFLIAICNINQNHSVSVSPFMFERNNPNDYTQYRWQILEGTSPFRERLTNEGIDLFTFQNTNQGKIVNTLHESNDIHQRNVVKKPEMPSYSFWLTEEGKYTMKGLHESLSQRNNIKNLEILQKADSMIAFRFNYNNLIHEMGLPHEYPQKPIFVSTKLSDNSTSIIELPIGKGLIPSEIDSVLKYMEKKFRRKYF